MNADPVLGAGEAYQQALALHQTGRIDEARKGYERVLSLRPEDAAALQMLGVIALEMSDLEGAAALLDRAIASDPACIMAHIYRGVACSMLNQHEAAIGCFDRAIAIDPDSNALAHYSRANSLLQLGRYERALESYERAVSVGSDLDAEAYFGCGAAQRQLRRHPEALASFERAIALGVQNQAAAHLNRGTLLMEAGQHEAALGSFDRVLALLPDHAEVHFNRGSVLVELGRQDAAQSSFERAIRCDPNHARALYNLGLLHQNRSNFKEAHRAYEAAIRADGKLLAAYANDADLLRLAGRCDEAEQLLRRGLALDPAHASLHVSLGNALKDQADIVTAIQCFRRALELEPDNGAALSALAFSLMFASEQPQETLAACRLFNDRLARPLRGEAVEIGNDGPHDRRLRIGYVSADFRNHCQSFFTIPLLEHHDRSKFEIFCYSSVTRPDDWTSRIKGSGETYREVQALDDEALAALVRADRIDILVDLAMHMADGRPLLFARKPAPLQVAWLAYPGTTGLDAIDYRFSDPRLDPPGYEAHYAERTVRLPDAFWCYDPVVATPAVNALPAATRGRLTLGCLNNPCKLTDRTLRLWAPALRALPGARLLLLFPTGAGRQRFLARARAAGIDETVIEFVERRAREDYLASYHDIDICLDTVPYNGHTTTLDALWMGVPVVTRVGPTSVGRGGLSLLYQLGLTELAAGSDEQFTSVLVALANDLPRLASLRDELRSRLQSSPLMDGARFATNVEAAYRTIWLERVNALARQA